MDGDPVTGKPLEDDDKPAAPRKTYTELFMQIFPEYLAMGMTYDEFWHGEAWLVSAYRKAHKERMRVAEWERWRQGAYIYDALLRVAPIMRAFGKGKVEPGEYPDEPYPLSAKEARERQERQDQDKYERYIAKMKAASDRELQRRALLAAEKEDDEDGGH